MFSRVSYVGRETWASLRRNLTLTIAALLTIAVSLTLLGIWLLAQRAVANTTQRWKGGVEFIVFASAWESQDPNPAGPPSLEGHLLNFVDAPNRFGLEPFYALHVWAWENNPTGSFADWNARVSCEKQPSE